MAAAYGHVTDPFQAIIVTGNSWLAVTSIPIMYLAVISLYVSSHLPPIHLCALLPTEKVQQLVIVRPKRPDVLYIAKTIDLRTLLGDPCTNASKVWYGQRDDELHPKPQPILYDLYFQLIHTSHRRLRSVISCLVYEGKSNCEKVVLAI